LIFTLAPNPKDFPKAFGFFSTTLRNFAAKSRNIAQYRAQSIDKSRTMW